MALTDEELGIPPVEYPRKGRKSKWPAIIEQMKPGEYQVFHADNPGTARAKGRTFFVQAQILGRNPTTRWIKNEMRIYVR